MHRISPGKLAADVNTVQQCLVSNALSKFVQVIFRQQVLHFCRSGREGLNPGRNETQEALHVVEWFCFPVRQEQPARDWIKPFEIVEKGRDFRRILAFLVIEEHVTAKVRVPSQDFVGAFACEYNFVTSVAYSSA